MSRSRKLTPVVTMARQATETELLKLGEVNAMLQHDQQQLDELIRYRDEYLTRFREENSMVNSVKKALDLRGFLAQLDQAIQAQQYQVDSSRSRVEQQRQSWLQARNKEQAMDTLVARYQAEEVQKQQRREQRDNDEHTTTIWARKR